METKGVTCKIPLDLHNQISEEIRETESTMSKFIEMIIREHYEKGANRIMEKGRTLAFQVSEELFQRVKEYLENYEKAYHRRLTQKEFVIGLIEQALEEAEEEFEAARAAEHEEQAENGWEAAETAESDEDEEVSDDEEAEDWDEENGETEGLSADEETTGSSWEPAENTETDEGEEGPSEDDEDTGEIAYHSGTDIGAPDGTPILAAADGTVTIANAIDSWGGGYGYHIKISHNDTFDTLYAHCSSICVTVGQEVKQGEVIGYVGTTGNSTGNHLHFEVWQNGERTDALRHFKNKNKI